MLALGVAGFGVSTMAHAAPEDKSKCPATPVPTPAPEPAAVKAAQAQRKHLLAMANLGEPDAMTDLASLMEQGDDAAPIDRAGALDLYEKAADKADQIGRRKMCIAYLLGEGRTRDVVKGMPYCNALGVKDPVGLFAAGYDYEAGLSGPKDEGVAMGLYVEAVQLGSGDAAAALGRKALGLNKPDAARQWFRRGVYLGSADAMDSLAVMAGAGQGGPADPVEARWLYAAAAERGNTHAAVQASPTPAEMPVICLEGDGKKTMPIIHTYTDTSGPHHETIGFPALMDLLSRGFPQAALDNEVEGDATIECYVADDHSLDACVLKREFPVGFGYGPTLETVFNGHIAVGEQDAGGLPTEHRLMKLTARWRIN